jgi:hypothetical protein
VSKPSQRRRIGRVVAPEEGMSASLLATARAGARAGLPAALTTRTFMALVGELGSGHEAWAFIGRLAEEPGRPVFTNGPRDDGQAGSRTGAIAPAHWTQERLAGFTASYKDEFAAMFGQVDGTPDWPGRAA